MTQGIDYAAILPPVVLGLTGVLVLVADLFLPAGRKAVLGSVSVGGTVAAAALAGWLATTGTRRTFCVPATTLRAPVHLDVGRSCSYVVDGFTSFFAVLFLVSLLVVLLLAAPTVVEERLPAGEFHALLLWSVTGMLVLAAARDLVTLLVALEVVSLPAFVLVGLRRGDPRAAEAALKFFVFSVASTALTLYGIALLYGSTGSLQLDRVAAALAVVHGHAGATSSVAAAGVVLVLVGFGFKISAVPFHAWAPDTYQGASVPVAAFLSVASKAAGFAGLLLLVEVGLRPYADVWGPVLAVLAAVTMTVGNLVALRQSDVVRLLAWSTVAQAGYMLVPLGVAATAGGRSGAQLRDAAQATLAYLAIYAAMNLGAFACVAVVSRRSPRRAIADYRGLVATSPWLAVAFAVFLTALAGLPPGVAGLFAKVTVLRAAVHGHVTWLAVVAAVNAVIGLAYYLRVAALLFAGAGDRTAAVTLPVTPRRSPALVTGLVAAVLATAALSVDPQPLLHWAGTAARGVVAASR